MDFLEVAAGRLPLRCQSKVVEIQPEEQIFRLKLAGGEQIKAARVLLAVGRRGSPRKLGVPGEERAKVVYSLKDPDLYEGQKVLVVGGGNSAAESALMLSELPNSEVSLAYRGAQFHRVFADTRAQLESAVKAGKLRVMMESNLLHILADQVRLEGPEGEVLLENEAVIVQIGGELPEVFLNKIGLLVDQHYGSRVVEAEES